MLDATELGTLHGTQEYGSKWLRWFSESLCSDTVATVNADIGGIGVSSSQSENNGQKFTFPGFYFLHRAKRSCNLNMASGASCRAL